MTKKPKKAPAVLTQTFKYNALSYRQRRNPKAPAFVIFHASAHEIAEWADVDRLAPGNMSGAQRPLRGIKVNKVKKYFDEPLNTIPTAVVIALDDAAVSFTVSKDKAIAEGGDSGTFVIRKTGSKKPGLIIDGQHRVFGTMKSSASTHLNIVAFLGGDDAERAFQFVVINNSATKVPKDHIKALNLSYDPERLNKRLIESAGLAMGISEEKYGDLALLDGSPPFKALIDWTTNKNGFIAANALESALGETKDRASMLGIDGLERDVFLSIWSSIKTVYSDIWGPFKGPTGSRLLQKVSIFALTIYVLDSMLAKQRTSDDPIDFTDIDVLNALVVRVVKRIPSVFWTAKWSLTELDTSSGRKHVVNALQVIDSNIRFNRPWYDQVELIDPSLLHDQASSAPSKSKAKPTRKR